MDIISIYIYHNSIHFCYFDVFCHIHDRNKSKLENFRIIFLKYFKDNMGNSLINWLKSLFWKQEMELTLVGLQNSGKSTLVNVLSVCV